jgi:5-methylcytosine-specific restriction endonuclease McrA
MKLCRECEKHPVHAPGGHKCRECMDANELRYKASRRSAAIRPLVRRQVWNDAQNRCEYCGVYCHPKRNKYDSADTIGEVDHIIPAALGGTGERTNLKLSCKRCNRRRENELRVVVRRHIDDMKRHKA